MKNQRGVFLNWSGGYTPISSPAVIGAPAALFYNLPYCRLRISEYRVNSCFPTLS